MQAGVLACGEGAVVSHGTAAELLGLWDRRPALIHVIGPGERGRGIEGIRWHRVRAVLPDERTVSDEIPCTTVARTLVDLSGGLGRRSLSRLVEAAAVKRLLDPHAVDLVLARGAKARRPGPPRGPGAVAGRSPEEAEERARGAIPDGTPSG